MLSHGCEEDDVVDDDGKFRFIVVRALGNAIRYGALTVVKNLTQEVARAYQDNRSEEVDTRLVGSQRGFRLEGCFKF